MKDRSNNEIKNGSIVNINEAVNGCCLFVVLDAEKLDIRYGHDLSRKYEYDKRDLLGLIYTDESDVDVVGNIYDLINNCKSS